MVLNIKNLFKKVCMLSAAATMAVGLGASFAGATPPGITTKGAQAGTAQIDQASNALEVTVTTHASPYTFDGTAKQLIDSVSVTSSIQGDTSFSYYGENSSVDLWLRVDTSTDTPTNAQWVRYTDESSGNGSLLDTNLTKTDAGNYYVFYYVDGKTNYSDITGAQ
jgi:hypothetical protein